MSREDFFIIARFPSKDETQQALRKALMWLQNYSRQEDAEFA